MYYGIRLRGTKVADAKNPEKLHPTLTGKYKWLDIQKLAESLRASDEVVKVKYFTAKIRNDVGALDRQQRYLDALSSLPKVEIIYGRFLESHPTMCCHPLTEPPTTVKVVKREEKGSDVNLCSHLIIDGMNGEYEAAAVISNDTDFCFPISYVKNQLKKPVFVFNPKSKNAKNLESCSTSIYQINNNMLQSSQFPDVVNCRIGNVSRPTEWQ